jgi:alkylhydroperoxidase family enzyme
VTPRIAPIDPPYAPAVAAQLEAMTPPQTAPIALFRTFVHNFDMTEAMTGWGRYELSRRLSVSMRDREIVIDRVCARCGCEYEWGVHVAHFAVRVDLTDAQIASLTCGGPDDPCWTDERDRSLIAMVDTLHDHNDIDDDTWRRLTDHFDQRQLLDLLLLAGWYHAISYVARAARIDLEPGAPRFGDVADSAEPLASPVGVADDASDGERLRS